MMSCFPKQSSVGVLNAFAGPLLIAKDPKASAIGEKTRFLQLLGVYGGVI